MFPLPSYIHRTMDHIYLGDHRAVIDYGSFDLVINLDFPANGVSRGAYVETPVRRAVPTPTRLIRVGVEDNEKTDLTPFVDKLVGEIKAAVARNQRVLIMSRHGTGRAAAILSSYLVRRYQFSTSDVMHMFQTAQFQPDMNVGFMRQLEQMQIKSCCTNK
jgi:hypothetical protein